MSRYVSFHGEQRELERARRQWVAWPAKHRRQDSVVRSQLKADLTGPAKEIPAMHHFVLYVLVQGALVLGQGENFWHTDARIRRVREVPEFLCDAFRVHCIGEVPAHEVFGRRAALTDYLALTEFRTRSYNFRKGLAVASQHHAKVPSSHVLAALAVIKWP